MEFFSGLDVAMERSAICVVDDKGEVQMQTEIVTDPDAIAAALKAFLPRLRRAGHEAASLSPWLQPELAKRGLPAVCLEARHVRAALSGPAQQDRCDGCAGVGAHRADRPVPPGPYQDGVLLSAAASADAAPQPEAQGLDLENAIRHSLKAFGIRIKGTGRTGFDAAVREAVAGDALTAS
jgi:transposase